MTNNEHTPTDQNHQALLGATLYVNDFASLAVADIQRDDLTAALHSLNRTVLSANSAMSAIVDEAREGGATWQMIADALMVTKQAAQQKYSDPWRTTRTIGATALGIRVDRENIDQDGHEYETTITTNSKY